MLDREQCLECMGPLRLGTFDRWQCRPCDRAGYFDVAVVDGRTIAVRMVTRWRNAEGQVCHG